MKLTEIELQSAAWQKLKAYMEQRLDECRRRNDGDLNEIETARLRGRIGSLKELLAIGEPTPAQAEPDV